MKNKFDSFEMAMLIKEIYSSTMNILSSSLKESGLTHQQIMVIKIIGHNKEVTISKLCEEMHLAKGTVSGIVQRLESIGYLEKIKYDSDKRNTYVRFSDKGLEFSKEFRMKINNSFDIVFDKFTNEEGERAIEERRRIKDKIKKIN